MSIRNLDARINKKVSSSEILDVIKYELYIITGIVCLKLFI